MDSITKARLVESVFAGDRCDCCNSAPDWLVEWDLGRHRSKRCTDHVKTIQCPRIETQSLFWVSDMDGRGQINLAEWNRIHTWTP